MEILIRLGGLLSPSFFAVLAGLSLTAAALLFVAGKHNTLDMRVRGTKLSTLEPTEYRGTAYLVLAFGWSIVGLVLSFIFATIGASFLAKLLLVSLSLLCLLFTLCFLYAGGGTLFHAITGKKGRIIYFFFPFMEPIDNLIARFGDLLTVGLFRQLGYSRIATETVLAKEVKETPATEMSGYEEAKASEETETLLSPELARYEARLTLEQREKLTELRGIVEKLRSMYP
jgi:hypothetical protein